MKEQVGAFGRDELRDERKEEESGLGIERFRDDALTKSIIGRSDSAEGQFRAVRTDHADDKKDEVRGSGVLDGMECESGSGKDGRHSERCSKNLKESAKECADGRGNALTAATGKRPRQNIENAWAWCDGEYQRRGEKERESMVVEHGEESIKAPL